MMMMMLLLMMMMTITQTAMYQVLSAAHSFNVLAKRPQSPLAYDQWQGTHHPQRKSIHHWRALAGQLYINLKTVSPGFHPPTLVLSLRMEVFFYDLSPSM